MKSTVLGLASIAVAMTAIPAVVATQLIEGKKLLDTTGVFAPESVLPAKEFFHGLSAAGLKVTETLLEERELNS